MKEYRLTDWLPTTKKEVELRGWDELDVILFSGDAYVDHPSFGAAVIGRILEAEGLRVAIIPQPNWLRLAVGLLCPAEPRGHDRGTLHSGKLHSR